MALRLTITKAMALIAAAFPSYRKSEDLADILFEELYDFSDAHIIAAAKHLVTTAQRAPTVADVIEAVRSVSGYRPPQTKQPTYVDYWDRPPKERAEIDEARNECVRIMAALTNGVSVHDLYPPDSEPCMLARRFEAMGKNNKKHDGTPEQAGTVADRALAALAGEVKKEPGRFDW